jgi:hypothetical protein
MMATEFGLAKNNVATIEYLSNCQEVLQVFEISDRWLIFSFDPTVEIPVPPLQEIWFDWILAPPEGKDVLNRFVTMSDDDTIA